MKPHDPSAGWAARGGHLRASDADRERVIDALKDAFVQGRLTRSELARRAGQALESKTYADLASATAGIPAGRAATAPRQHAAAPPARRVNWKVVAWVLSAIIVLPGLGVAFFATYYGSLYIMLLLWGIGAAATGAPWPSGDGHRSMS
jgi:DUF1707 SHOCT-like domain